MSRVPYLYPYENDDERLLALGNRIVLRRLEDVIHSEGYVLHNSIWWRVCWPSTLGALGLEIAGPKDPIHPRTSTISGSPSDLVIYADADSGLQFQEGTLLDTPWPVGGLIYVAEAHCRGVGDDPDELVHGIFAPRFEEDGGSYYVPVDPEHQPGVVSTWLLYPERDLVLDWSPVDVYDLRARMEAAHAEV